MGILLYHSDVAPASEFLQHMDRCSSLNMPGSPGVSQVVPTEIREAVIVIRMMRIERILGAPILLHIFPYACTIQSLSPCGTASL